MILSLWTKLLEIVSDVHQTWQLYVFIQNCDFELVDTTLRVFIRFSPNWYVQSPNTMMIYVKRGHVTLRGHPGVIWVKNLENFTILSLWTQLFEFSLDFHQIGMCNHPTQWWSMWKGVMSRSGVIQVSFWVKNLENFTILSLRTQLLEFTSVR